MSMEHIRVTIRGQAGPRSRLGSARLPGIPKETPLKTKLLTRCSIGLLAALCGPIAVVADCTVLAPYIQCGQTIAGEITSEDCPGDGFYADLYRFAGANGQQVGID